MKELQAAGMNSSKWKNPCKPLLWSRAFQLALSPSQQENSQLQLLKVREKWDYSVSHPTFTCLMASARVTGGGLPVGTRVGMM